MAIRAKVKKPFPYARDHINSRQMQVGEVEAFPDDVFAGLEASGHLEKSSEPLTAPAAELDWSALGDSELVSMIRSRAGEEVNAGNLSHTELVERARRAFLADTPDPGAAPKAVESAPPADGRARATGKAKA